jgi:hypothetical protein
MGERSLDHLASLPHEALAVRASSATSVPPERRAHLCRLVLPTPPTADLRLRDTGPDFGDGAPGDDGLGVVALVGNEREVRTRNVEVIEGLDDSNQSRRRRLVIREVGGIDRRSDDRSSLDVDRILRLVRQVRSPVLRPRDSCVRVRRRLPVLVRGRPVLALLVEPRLCLSRRSRLASLFREAVDVSAVALVVSLRTIDRIVALASIVLASSAGAGPLSRPASFRIARTSLLTARNTSTGSRRRTIDSEL